MKNSQESSKVARQSDNRATSKHDVNLRKYNVVHFQVGLILALILAIIVGFAGLALGGYTMFLSINNIINP